MTSKSPGAAEGDLIGRRFLVTGANSGIGRAMVEALAARGADVVLACRSEERARPVLDAIRRQHRGITADFLPLDTSDLDSVRAAAARILAQGAPLDVLVNNAGIAGTRGLSNQGFDLTYATNYIGPFLLTNLLLPLLKQSPGGRVVNVSSKANKLAKQIDWTVLDRRPSPRPSGLSDYAATKLMNVLHASELARRLTGTRVTAYSLHPGVVATNVWRDFPRPLQWFLKLFMLSSEEGAQTMLHCATAADLSGVTGRYYDKCREARPNPLAEDEALAKELWVRTEAAITGVDSLPAPS